MNGREETATRGLNKPQKLVNRQISPLQRNLAILIGIIGGTPCTPSKPTWFGPKGA